VALYWLRGHQGDDAWDLNDVSEAQALWSLAFVLLVLRWQPPMGWLARVRPLDQAVDLLNARAVTVYLWHNIAVAAIWPVLTVLALDDLGHLDDPVDLVATLLLTLVAVLAFGWVEDLAARRRPRLWPVGRDRKAQPAPVPDPAGQQVTVALPVVAVLLPRPAVPGPSRPVGELEPKPAAEANSGDIAWFGPDRGR
jgi:peptidoglycan/LPS O-acetylase OafA/YrhL